MTDKVFSNLANKVLIASPHMLKGDIFHQTMIYLLSHNEDGAIGLIVNYLVNQLSYKKLFKLLNHSSDISDLALPVYFGGPVEPERGFVLHSGEYTKNSLFQFPQNISVSSNMEIVKDIASGSGPKNSLFILGYTGWEKGQLNDEIKNNLWLVADCDTDLIFSNNNEEKWDIALKNMGIQSALFTTEIGHG